LLSLSLDYREERETQDKEKHPGISNILLLLLLLLDLVH